LIIIFSKGKRRIENAGYKKNEDYNNNNCFFLLSFAFLNNDRTFAGVEDFLMPEAKVFVKGKIPSGTVDIDLILSDLSLNAIQIGDYVVWSESINDVVNNQNTSVVIRTPFRETLDLIFALSENGTFFFGCKGPLPDALSVIGTFCVSGDGSTANGWWDDDGKFEPKDIALVGIGYTKLKDLENKGYVTGVDVGIYTFRDCCSVEVKHKLEKKVTVIYYTIFIRRGNENPKPDSCGGPDTTNWGVCFPLNYRWCPFGSPLDNGIAKRSCQINYDVEIASYTYCGVYNNNGSESSWINFDGDEIVRRDRCCFTSMKLYDVFPLNIDLGGRKTWSETNPTVIMTVVADSVSASNWSEDPSLGLRRNPPPDILIFEPNVWYGDFIYTPENPEVGKEVAFDAYSSPLDPKNEVLTYTWDFGDGDTAEGVAVTHTYSESGIYNVELKEIDKNERERTFTQTVAISKSDNFVINQLMEDAKLIEKVQTNSTVDLDAIVNDAEFNAVRQGDYVLWNKQLNEDRKRLTGYLYWWTVFPETVTLQFAIDNYGNFFVGAIGPDADVLSVLTDGGIYTTATWGYQIPEGRELNHPWLELDERSNVLAWVLYDETLELKERNYINGGPNLVYSMYGTEHGKVLLDFDLLKFRLISKYDKPITILGTYLNREHSDGIYCCGMPEQGRPHKDNPVWPLCDALNHKWNPMPTDVSDGESYRWLTLNYNGVEASFVSTGAHGDNSNRGHVKLDSEIKSSFINWTHESNRYRAANEYPNDIELYLKTYWSFNRSYFKIAILGGEISYSNVSESPTGGMDGNPEPLIWVIDPYPGDDANCIDCIFRAGIKASGQGQEHGVPGAYSVSTVYIGMDEAASTYKTPGAPPNWTVYMKVSGDLNEDIRQIGSEREEWVLTVDIGEYADPNLGGYYPVLSWDNNEFCAQVCSKKFRLYSEDTEGRLTLLVEDMHKTNSYQTKAEEAECALDMCRLTYYIIWSKDVLFEMNLSVGWTMISLPVKPESLLASDLFPEAEVIYGFAKGIGYDRVKVGEELEVGKGYWILLPEEQRYSLIGKEIEEYTHIVEDGWLMIGSCTSPSKAFIDKGAIDVIYGLNPSVGYQRVLASEKLKPCAGYWILFSDVIGHAELTVKNMETRGRLRAGTGDNRVIVNLTNRETYL
jgi:PKD repeat protein